jgi:hypothetical protein
MEVGALENTKFHSKTISRTAKLGGQILSRFAK